MEIKRLTLNQYDILGNRKELYFSQISGVTKLDELVIKNCEIKDDIINKISNLEIINRLVFINCIFDADFDIKNAKSVRFDNCKNIHKCVFEKGIEKLYIENCDYIDVKNIEILNLIALRIENTKTKNLGKISNIKSLVYLYLNYIYLKEKINYDMLINLKKLDLSGSYVDNKEEYLEQFKEKQFELIFLEENLKIG